MAKQLYKIEIMFHAVEGREEIHSWSLIDSFAVAGGIQRQIWTDRRDNLNEADIMSEFYEARHFKNLTIQKQINRSSLEIAGVFYRKLSFSFTFQVTSLPKSPSFRFMILRAEDGEIPDPPRRDSKEKGVKVTFTNPEIIYYPRRSGWKSC